MVGGAGEEGVHAINLLQQHHEGQLMLHGVAPQAEHMVAGCAESGGVTICRADEESHVLDRLELPAAHAGFQLASGPVFAAFIHGDAQAALAGFQQAGGNSLRIPGLHIADFNLAQRAQAVLKKFRSVKLSS